MAPTADHSPRVLDGIAEDLRLLATPRAELSHVQLDVQLDDPPPVIRSAADAARARDGVVRRAVEAERDGVHAVIIDCTDDVGLPEARERLRIPVFGPGEALRACIGGRPHVFLTADVLADDPFGAAWRAVKGGAEVIVIGGTGWSAVAATLRLELASRGSQAEVLDPLPVALYYALSALDAVPGGRFASGEVN